MKRAKNKNFTMIELLFIIGILVILMSISWVAGSKVILGTKKQQTKAEITMLFNAVKAYKARYSAYPWENQASAAPTAGGAAVTFTYGHQLSKAPHESDGNYNATATGVAASAYNGNRPMYIDYTPHGFNVSNDNYKTTGGAACTVKDPYEQAYQLKIDADGKFTIFSPGVDGTAGTDDDITSNSL